jgi:hypothetical protein
MHSRFHAISPDELNLRPSLPFVQEMGGLASGAATVEDSEIASLQKKQMDRDGHPVRLDGERRLERSDS